MSHYRLNLHFKEEDLKIINNKHQRVVMVKHTEGKRIIPVTWVCFRPCKENTVDWNNTFALYASTTVMRKGATINTISDKMAAEGVEYDFMDGCFSSPKMIGTAAKPDTYYVKNTCDDYPAVTLGLAQSVAVNGMNFTNNPTNAVYVPYGQQISMTPVESIDVFLQNDITDRMVISHNMRPPIPVVFGDGESEHSIMYNGMTGQFCLEV